MPHSANVLDTCGWALAKSRRFGEAERYLLDALHQKGPVAATRYHLGWVYEQQGKYREAAEQYRQGLKMIKFPDKDPMYKKIETAMSELERKMRSGTGQ